MRSVFDGRVGMYLEEVLVKPVVMIGIVQRNAHWYI